MKKIIYPVLLAILSVFLYAPQSGAYTINTGYLCANGSGGAANLGADLQAALSLAAASEDYEVRLRDGTFSIPNNAHFVINTAFSQTISGGWNADCSVQTANPRLSVLDGGATQNSADGGGVLLVLLDNPAAETLTISNLTISNGSSLNDGGGLSIWHGNDTLVTSALATLDILNVIIELNTTEVWFGSGLAISDSGSDGGIAVNITDSIVQDNGTVGVSADLPGPGGIFIDNAGVAGGEISITHSQILNNIAEADGGGLFINNGISDLTLVNNVIAGNYSASGYGAGILIENLTSLPPSGGNVTLTNNTITGNLLADSPDGIAGGGISLDMNDAASVLNIYNNIIYGNGFDVVDGTAGDGADIDINNSDAAMEVNLNNNNYDTTVTTGIIIANTLTSNINNLNVDPLFVDALNDDYRLMAASPVIDIGDDAVAPADDLAGVLRPQGLFVDIGAHEYEEVKVTGIADFDGNGTADVLLRNKVNGKWHLFLMNGASNVPNYNIGLPLDLNLEVAGIADFDGDVNGTADLLLRNKVNGKWHLFLMNGASNVPNYAIPLPQDLNMEVAGIADFDGLVGADVLLRNTVNGKWHMFLMNGATVTPSYNIDMPTDLNLGLAGIADFDGLVGADVLLRNTVNGKWHMFLMNGATVTPSYNIDMPTDLNLGLAGIADFDGLVGADVLLRNTVN
ncbi:choice-of-anchor Q domain-containing protein, partial [Thermodesulfobacteriota bacterium]